MMQETGMNQDYIQKLEQQAMLNIILHFEPLETM